MEEKRLEFLDLETTSYRRGGTIDHRKLVCFAEGKEEYKHIFHVKKQKDNSLSDLIYQNNYICDLCSTILHNLACERQSSTITIQSFLNLSKKHKEGLAENSAKILSLEESLLAKNKKLLKQVSNLEQKVDSLVLSSERSYLSKLPTKKDVEDLLLRIDQEPKKIEQETVQLAKELDHKVHKLGLGFRVEG